jgi:hypothetical protein
MKIDELVQNVPANIAGLPENMKFKAHSETGISEKTVHELRARTTWPTGLMITTPRRLKTKS